VKINISNLSQGTHEYDLSKSAAEIGLDERFDGEVSARVVVEKSSRQLLLRGDISANALFHCDRCLEEFRTQMKSALQTLYVWNSDERSEAEDVRILAPDENMIDISSDVRDIILLSVPLKLLCKENCAGLCPRCGKNLNHTSDGRCDCSLDDIDPRWNKLAGLAEVSILKKRN